MSQRERRRREVCGIKQRFATWDEAEAAAMRVWREDETPHHVNPPGAYPCIYGDERHYHFGTAAAPHGEARRKRKRRLAAVRSAPVT